jgi:hypothetical protein
MNCQNRYNHINLEHEVEEIHRGKDYCDPGQENSANMTFHGQHPLEYRQGTLAIEASWLTKIWWHRIF